jgi:hypothetical protein
MLIAGKNNGRFFMEKFYLVNTNNFCYYDPAKNKYGGLCAPRRDAAIGPSGADFVW